MRVKTPAGRNQGVLVQRQFQLTWFGDRRLAGVVLAHVGGRSALDQRLAFQQGQVAGAVGGVRVQNGYDLVGQEPPMNDFKQPPGLA